MRHMNASDFWQNFRLGEELHTAGSFIYNGLRRFHELEHFENGDELFEFLYNVSVGLERLLKIAVVLSEHTQDTDHKVLEDSIATHNHLNLLTRIKNRNDIKLSKAHIDLLLLLSDFYKTLRYDRFSLSSVYAGNREADAIREFLGKHLNVQFPENRGIFVDPNEDRYRAFMSRTILKISQTIFDIVDGRSRERGLYTYELRHGSKAQSVFLSKVKISDEDVLWKELLIFFMNASPNTNYWKFLKDIEPLRFDAGLINDYLACFKSDAAKSEVMDELDHHYEGMDVEARKQRFEMMALIGARGVYFDDDDDDGNFDEDSIG